MMLDDRKTAAETPTPKPKLGKRISWEALYVQRPDLRPDNDNQPSDLDDGNRAALL